MNVTSSNLAEVLAFGVVFAVVFVTVRVWRRRVPGLKGAASLRAATYLVRYAAGLEYYGLRRGEINAHVDTLRSDLAAAAETDSTQSLERLGPPRTLAAEVTSHLLRPSWLRGSIWAGATLLATTFLNIILTEAFLGGFEPLARAGETGDWSALGFAVDATMGDEGHASSIGFGSFWLIFAPFLAFVVGARTWRAFSRNGSRARGKIE